MESGESTETRLFRIRLEGRAPPPPHEIRRLMNLGVKVRHHEPDVLHLDVWAATAQHAIDVVEKHLGVTGRLELVPQES